MYNSELEKDIQREIQVNLEKEKLDSTISIINKEITSYLEKRRQISDYIMDYRKKVLDEYEDDEDKVTEYFDHERFVIEEQFRHIDKKLKELTILSTSPYFGKVDFTEEDMNELYSIYIGRFGITLDDTYEPLVIDWRAPVASLFYTGKLGDNSYKSPVGEIKTDILNKRQFIIKKSKLLGMFDSAIDVKDEILQMVLSSNSSDKLKDIVMTIQSEQDNLIRQSRNKTIVVDGVAGSGKTTIALHRIAYLLYNYRKVLGDKVLILGPNNIFIEYISSVLPSLGEVGVKQSTFREFALDLIDLDCIMNFKEYMESIINGEEDFIENVLKKTSIEFIGELDNLIRNLEYSYFNIRDVKFLDETIVESKEIDKMFGEYFKQMPLFRRSKKIKRILYSKIKDYRDKIVRRIQKEYRDKLDRLSKEEVNLYGNDLEFKRKLEIRSVIKEIMKTKQKLTWIDNPDILEIYNKFNNNNTLIYDDLAPILYLKIKLEGITSKDEIKHIVIDEAQDYSMLQFMVIKEITKCQHYTIVGDSNQRIIPTKENISMEELNTYIEFKDIEYFKLLKSYRSTQEIMNYANRYINSNDIVPLVRSGKEVVQENISSKKELEDRLVCILKDLKNKEYENIAVICKDAKQTNYIGKILKKSMYIKIIDKEENLYTSGELVIPSYLAKGLEFDAVIVLDEGYNRVNYEKMMYVMSTRALHELYVLKTK
ncbi:HelD family protein [Clostridium rectalis]|uniref:HelD family protein n=1 Tax=Clostridium rectalis TaxID=2040295 RepID=UPI000F640580|nr:UvrD-helicase domain-containing protein [Clostridium rectalis]